MRVTSKTLSEVAREEAVEPTQLMTWINAGQVQTNDYGRIPIFELIAIRALRDGLLICPRCRNTRRDPIYGGECQTCGVLRLRYGVCQSCGQDTQITTDSYHQCLSCRSKHGAEQIETAVERLQA